MKTTSNPHRCLRIRTALATVGLLAVAAAAPADPADGPARDLGEGKTLYVVPYSHLDTQWRWDYRTTISEYIPSTLDGNFALIDKYPSYLFNFTGSRRYALAKEYYPESYERMKGYIADGRWAPVGSTVDECDVNVPSPESLVRQVLYGNEYFRREFGKDSDDFMLPDCFGFPASLPSVLAHCGVKGFHTQKLTWGSAAGRPFRIGVWYGPDGKGVTAMLDGSKYTGGIREDLSRSEERLKNIDELGAASGVFADYRYFGTGDKGGPPPEASVAKLADSVASDGPVKVVASRSDQLFRDLTPEQRERLPVYAGDLLLTEHSAGSITSQAWVKRWNRKGELLADSAEKASAAAAWLGAAEYPYRKLEEAWYLVLGNQMHDILPGTSIPEAYRYTWNDQVLALNLFASALRDSVAAATNALDTRGEGQSLVVYNPLGVARTDVVQATVAFPGGAPRAVEVFDGEGRQVPVQNVAGGSGGEIRFLFPASVPSVGFAVYDVRPAAPPSPEGEAPAIEGMLAATPTSLENDRYRVTLDKAGDVSGIFDKSAGREMLSAPLRLAILDDSPAQWPAWNMDWEDVSRPPRTHVGGAARIRVVESGPVRATIEVERMCEGSRFVQRISLVRGGQIVEFRDMVDWRSKDACLKAVFPLAVSNDKAVYDMGLGVAERANSHAKLFEFPSHEWMALEDRSGTYTVAIAKEAKYGSDKPTDGEMRLTLLRSPACTSYHDQGTQDFGRHDIRYAIGGVVGGWSGSDIPATASAFNQPAVPFHVPQHEGDLGKSFSFARTDDANLAIQALKMAEDGDGLVVRVQETSGGPARRATIGFAAAVESAVEVDGQERELERAAVDGGRIAFEAGPHSIHSFRVRLAGASTPRKQAASVGIPLPANADVASRDGEADGGAMDAQRRSFPGEMMRTPLESGNAFFELGSSAPGDRNATRCEGQMIGLPGGDWNTLSILAASTDGEVDASFTVDGVATPVSVQPWTGFVGQWDDRIWKNGAEIEGLVPGFVMRDTVAWFATHHHDAEGKNAPYAFSYLYKYDIPVAPGAKTLDLPRDPRIVLVAASLSADPARDVAPAADLYDSFRPYAEPPRIIPLTGEFIDSLCVRILRPWFGPNGVVRFTTDGSDPVATSPLADGGLWIHSGTTICAALFEQNGNRGTVARSTIEVADERWPHLLEATAVEGIPAVRLLFSEPVVPDSPEASFVLSGGAEVVSLGAEDDPCIVVVNLADASGLNASTTIAVAGVLDISPNANAMESTSIPVQLAAPAITLDGGVAQVEALGGTLVAGAAIIETGGLSALQVGGEHQCLRIPDRPELNPRSKLAITALVKPEQWPAKGNCRFVQKGLKDDQYGIHRRGDQIRFFIAGVGTMEVPSPPAGKWFSVAGTYDGSRMRFYIDGEEKGSIEASGEIAVTADPLFVGSKSDSSPAGDDFDGSIASVAIWHVALTPSQIEMLTRSAQKPDGKQ